IGVVIALGPTFSSFGWPVLIPLAGSLVYAVFLVVTRTLRATRDSVMATWQVVAALIFGCVGAPFAWTPLPGLLDALLLCALGVVALGAIIATNRSLA